MSTPVLGADRGTKALDSTKPCAWAVVSESTSFVGLFDSEVKADDFLNDPAAPTDAVMSALQEVPGTRRAKAHG